MDRVDGVEVKTTKQRHIRTERESVSERAIQRQRDTQRKADRISECMPKCECVLTSSLLAGNLLLAPEGHLQLLTHVHKYLCRSVYGTTASSLRRYRK